MLSWLLVFSFTIIKIKATCPISGTPSECYTTTNNLCAATNPQNYWPSCTGYCNYIQCDAGSGSFDMSCGETTVWDPSASVYGACSHPSAIENDSDDTATAECPICGTANVCYDTDQNSPCNPLITPNLYYYPSCTSRCHYIQCNNFGDAFDRPTAPGTVWDQSIPGNNHPPSYYPGQYFIGPDLLTADEANDYCEYYGTTLASIHSQEELDTVTALCNTYSSNGECHIGMRLNPSNGEWTWSDCTDTNFGIASDPYCERTANYIIIVDESGSVSRGNFEKSYDFAIDQLVDPVTGAINAESKIGAFSFGSVNDFVYDVAGVQNDNRASLLAALLQEKNDYDRGETKTAQALQYAVNMFANAGITTDKVIILLTDGYPCCDSSAYPCTNTALKAALSDVEIYNILVDDFSTEDLTCLFEPGNTNVFEIGRNFDFSTVIQRIEDYQTSGECQMIDVASDGSSYFCATPCDHKKRPICNGAPTDPRPAPAAKTVNTHVLNNGHLGGHGKNVHGMHGMHGMNGINDVINVKNVPVEHKYNYFGYIWLIGVIAFILINNVFVGCWCLGKGRNKAHAKFDMVSVNDSSNDEI